MFLIESFIQFLCLLSFLRRVGADAYNALSQPMISRYISRYTNLIVNNLSQNYIRFPQTVAEIEETKRQFHVRYNLPGILGVIDGTHVSITALSHNIEHAFVNRKGSHSINVQIACNARMIITNINSRFPGSTHDSYIFLGSQLHIFLKNLYIQDPNNFNFLIGL